MAPRAIEVYLEVTPRLVFACAYDWPGFARKGRDEAAALENLAVYGPRYAPVARAGGLAFEAASPLKPVERLEGDGTTAFGVPARVVERDLDPLVRDEADRLLALVEGGWQTFDRIVASAPAELRKGPRGGGRDRDRIVAHVLGAETAYGRLIGVKLPEPDHANAPAVRAHRAALLDGLRAAGTTVTSADGKRRWPLRYAVRRIAWHALDHAWEIEDRSPG